jgi:hypothetical protein
VGFIFVRIALGAMLLAAAWLKAVALWNGELAGPLLSSPRWQVATIEVETLLGLWLLSGIYARNAWLAAVALFTTLSGFTLYLALDGQQSCKCFGALNVSPRVTSAMDMAAVVVLLVWRPGRGGKSPTRLVWGALQTVFGVGVCLALMSGAFLLASDDPVRALALLRGESITVDSAVTEIGGDIEGEQRELTLQLTNNTDRPIYVFGGTTAGYCNATVDLPTTISGRQGKRII